MYKSNFLNKIKIVKCLSAVLLMGKFKNVIKNKIMCFY